MLYFYNVTVCVYADVAELVDALDLGSSGFIRECSSHFIRTSAPHSGERFSFAALNRQGNVFSEHLAVESGRFLNMVFHNPVENFCESRWTRKRKCNAGQRILQ